MGDSQVDFYVRHVLDGVRLALGASGLLLTYLLMTPDRPQRGVLFAVVGAGAALYAATAALPLRRILGARHGTLLLYALSGGACVLLGALVARDGGAASPLVGLFMLIIFHGAAALPPAGVLVLGLTNVIPLLVLHLVDPGRDPARLLVVIGTLVLVSATAALVARNHRVQLLRQEDLARRLEELARTDGLTGCLNHRAFHERLADELARAERYGGPLTLLLLDVDRFKQVNDLHGHPCGDEVLLRLAGVLRSSARAADAAGRVGGEEFALLLPQTGPAEAEALAERLRAEVAALPGPVPVTVSVGLSSFPAPAATGRELLRQADEALYDAKRAGRDRVRAYRSSPRTAA